MNYSFEYIDIILLAMIAGFIFLRLRGILGKRTGFGEKLSTYVKQEVQNETFLPLAYEPNKDATPVASNRIFEPSKDDVVRTLVPRYLNTKVWQYLLESNASEQAARMLAMENATSNANDMIKDLTLQFNKARQTAITTEMLEIVSGAEALS